MSRWDDEFKFVRENRKIYRIGTWDDDTEDAPWDETTYRVVNCNMVGWDILLRRIPTGELFILPQDWVGEDLKLSSLDVVAVRKDAPLVPLDARKGEQVSVNGIVPADAVNGSDDKIPLYVTRRQYRLLVAGLVCLMESLMDWTTIQQLYESEGVAVPQPEQYIRGRDELMADAQRLKSMLYQAAKFFH